MTHAFLASLCAAALVIMLLQRKIMQVPNPVFGTTVIVLLALILTTVGYSNYKAVAIPATLEWITYGIAMYAVVAIGGRQKGPTIMLGSIFAGCVLLALLGIRDYGQMKAIDPTWRIFPQWVGPNAMAAILVVGFFIGLGLAINAERAVGFAIGFGCVAIGFALFLTQSKGGLLALLVSLVIYAVLLFLWTPRKVFRRAFGVSAGAVAAVAFLSVAISFQAKPAAGASGPSPGGRLVNASGSSEQSVGFRKLLWKSSVELIKRDPLGIGMGGFQYESARPGLTTQTHFAHEAYLQLAVEASPLATLLLVGAIGVWTRLLFRGGSKLLASQNVLRASVFAAVAAVLMHSLIDSDFSYYGVGVVMFMLFGLGLLLSSDAVAPEFLPTAIRRTAAGGAVLLALFLLFLGYTEGERGQARGYIAAKSGGDARGILESVRSSAPWDADASYLSAVAAATPEDRLAFAKETVALSPTTRNLRLLARTEGDAGMTTQALDALQRALWPWTQTTCRL